MSRFKHGWRPDKIDPRDHLYRKIAPPRTAPLPDSVDLRPKCSPVENQGSLGSCTAHALAGAVEFLEIKSGLYPTPASRLFIYFNERDMEGDVSEDGGAEIRDGVKSLNQIGVCPEPDWPYDAEKFAEKPPAPCYTTAEAHRIASYHRLLSLDDMLGCLADGYPFVFGFTVFSGFESEETAKTGIVNMPALGEENLGGHAVLCVGYDKPSQRFIVRNSWTDSWGQAGYFTIPMEYIETLADDFWVILK